MNGLITDVMPVPDKWTNVTKGDVQILAMSYFMYKIGILLLCIDELSFKI